MIKSNSKTKVMENSTLVVDPSWIHHPPNLDSKAKLASSKSHFNSTFLPGFLKIKTVWMREERDLLYRVLFVFTWEILSQICDPSKLDGTLAL